MKNSAFATALVGLAIAAAGSAAAQDNRGSCSQELIPGSVDGAFVYHCEDGNYYDADGRLVDSRGNALNDSEGEMAEPSTEEASPSEPAMEEAEPHFQKVPE